VLEREEERTRKAGSIKWISPSGAMEKARSSRANVDEDKEKKGVCKQEREHAEKGSAMVPGAAGARGAR
jgi:hypothetical protein